MSFSDNERIYFLRQMVEKAVGDDPNLKQQRKESEVQYLRRLARYFASAHGVVVDLIKALEGHV
jgi:hypothetical protein